MATRDKLQTICRRSLVAILIAFLFSCAVKHRVPEMQPVIWRASESNGDKPGVGYEIIDKSGKISGSFLLFEPNRPHNFETAVRIPMTLVKVSTNQYRATVHYPKSEADELDIRFDGPLEGSAKKAVIQQLNQPSSAGEFIFLRKR